MFGKRFDIFTLFGFPVRIDISWFVILFLVTWSLAAGYFPSLSPNLPAQTYWLMGIVGALGLFISIILHEFSHAAMARRFGLPITGITLFIFGGVSEMEEEPASAKAELLMAIAGPASSIVLAGLFYGLGFMGSRIGWPFEVNAVLGYLALINGLLAAFNIVPAFPLDGGRVLRAILWQWRGNLHWATRIASRIGSWFGSALVLLGIFGVLTGILVGGIWWVLIGLFLRWSANMAYQQLEIQEALSGEPVSHFMHPNPVAVPSDITIDELVQKYFYKHYFKMYPVVDEGHLRGCISLDQVKQYPQEKWGFYKVRDLAVSCQPGNTVSPDTDAQKALAMMAQTGESKLLVTEGDQLVGILTLRDLLRLLAIKAELTKKAA